MAADVAQLLWQLVPLCCLLAVALSAGSACSAAAPLLQTTTATGVSAGSPPSTAPAQLLAASQQPSEHSRAVSSAALAGTVVGIVIGVMVSALGLFWWTRRKRRKDRRAEDKARAARVARTTADMGPAGYVSPGPEPAGPAVPAMPDAPAGTPDTLTDFQRAAISLGVPGIAPPPRGEDSSASPILVKPKRGPYKDDSASQLMQSELSRRPSPEAEAPKDGSASQLKQSKLSPRASPEAKAPKDGSASKKQSKLSRRASPEAEGHPDGSLPLDAGHELQGRIDICQHPDGRPWVLGRNSFDTVYKALWNDTQEVAIRVQTGANPEPSERIQQDIHMLAAMQLHDNIVRFHGARLQGGPPMLVLEYMEGGSLRQVLNGPRCAELRWYRKGQAIMLDIARGLHFLHSNGVVHSQLTSSAILLSRDFSCAKVGETGLMRLRHSAYLTATQLGGLSAYVAPELLLNTHCSDKVDIFSFGVILWEIVTMTQPQRGMMRSVKVPKECPAAIAQLMDDCLQLNPGDRPTAKQVYQRIAAAIADGVAASTLPEISLDDLAGAQGATGANVGVSRRAKIRSSTSQGSSEYMHAGLSDPTPGYVGDLELMDAFNRLAAKEARPLSPALALDVASGPAKVSPPRSNSAPPRRHRRSRLIPAERMATLDAGGAPHLTILRASPRIRVAANLPASPFKVQAEAATAAAARGTSPAALSGRAPAESTAGRPEQAQQAQQAKLGRQAAKSASPGSPAWWTSKLRSSSDAASSSGSSTGAQQAQRDQAPSPGSPAWWRQKLTGSKSGAKQRRDSAPLNAGEGSIPTAPVEGAQAADAAQQPKYACKTVRAAKKHLGMPLHLAAAFGR